MPDEVPPGEELEPVAEQDGGAYLPEHPLDQALRVLGERASVAGRLEVVWAAYEAATGSTLTRPPLEAERQVVAAWVRSPDAVGNHPSFFSRERHLTPLLHESVVRKASRLTQAHCFSCTPTPSTSGPLGVSFPIGIEPWAAQSSQDKVAIRQAVAAALQKQGRHRMPWGDSPVCLSVTALVPRPSRTHRRKDVDNLVKGLIDALQGYLFQNDDAVQHLNIRRLEYAGAVGCYFVGAQPVAAPDADVIYDDPTPPRLMINHVEYPQSPAGLPTPPS